VIDVRPTRAVSVKKFTMSPTNTGSWNSTSRMALVTYRWDATLRASTADARSTWDRMTPPKIVPRAFVSLGRSRTLIAGMRASGIGRTGYRERRSSQAQGAAGEIDASGPDVLEDRFSRLVSPSEDSREITRGRGTLVVALGADVDLGRNGLSILELGRHGLAGEMGVFLGIQQAQILGGHPFHEHSYND